MFHIYGFFVTPEDEERTYHLDPALDVVILGFGEGSPALGFDAWCFVDLAYQISENLKGRTVTTIRTWEEWDRVEEPAITAGPNEVVLYGRAADDEPRTDPPQGSVAIRIGSGEPEPFEQDHQGMTSF